MSVRASVDDPAIDEAAFDSFNGDFKKASDAGAIVKQEVTTFRETLTTPQSNSQLFFKHSTFYGTVASCLVRLTVAFELYRNTFRLYFEGDDEERFELIYRAWEFLNESFVMANLLFLRDLPVTSAGDMLAVVDLDKSLNRQTETLMSLINEVMVGLDLG